MPLKNGTKKPKKKCCKKCQNKRFANTSLCYNHWRTRERLKKEEKAKKKLERKKLTKKYQKSLRKKLHRKAWEIFSKYIRRRSANFQGYAPCYTCYKSVPWKELHAGHRHHNRLDFDERNIKPQCSKCNTYLHGNLGAYERHIIEDNGVEHAKKLEEDSFKHQGYSVEELNEILKKYTELYNKL